MTLEEAQAIAYIVGEADSGCNNCVDDLLDKLQEEFTEFNWKSSFDSSEYVAHEKEKYLKVERRPDSILRPGCIDPEKLCELLATDAIDLPRYAVDWVGHALKGKT